MITHYFAIVILVFFLTFIPQAQTQTLYNGVGHIRSSYQVEWDNAGLITAQPAAADTVFQVNLNIRVTVDEKVRTTL